MKLTCTGHGANRTILPVFETDPCGTTCTPKRSWLPFRRRHTLGGRRVFCVLRSILCVLGPFAFHYKHKIPPSPKACPCVRSRGVASTCAARIDPITTTNTSLQPADLSWCLRVAPDKRENHRTTFLRCHRPCEALLDSSRIFCSVSGLVVLVCLAGCVFPGRACRQGGRNDVVVVFVEQAHATGLIIAAGV